MSLNREKESAQVLLQKRIKSVPVATHLDRDITVLDEEFIIWESRHRTEREE